MATIFLLAFQVREPRARWHPGPAHDEGRIAARAKDVLKPHQLVDGRCRPLCFILHRQGLIVGCQLGMDDARQRSLVIHIISPRFFLLSRGSEVPDGLVPPLSGALHANIPGLQSESTISPGFNLFLFRSLEEQAGLS